MSDEDDLARRLAALRGGNAALKKQPTTVPHQKQDEEDEQLSRRLASLETPSDNSSSKGQDVIVETKNLDDDAMNALLASLSTPPALSAEQDEDPLIRHERARVESALTEYEARSLMVSPISVSFNGGRPVQPSRTADEDEALIRRIQDELDVEKRVLARRHDDSDGGWEARMARLNGVVAGRSKYETVRDGVPDASSLDELKRTKPRKPSKNESDDITEEERDSDQESEEESKSSDEDE